MGSWTYWDHWGSVFRRPSARSGEVCQCWAEVCTGCVLAGPGRGRGRARGAELSAVFTNRMFIMEEWSSVG